MANLPIWLGPILDDDLVNRLALVGHLLNQTEEVEWASIRVSRFTTMQGRPNTDHMSPNVISALRGFGGTPSYLVFNITEYDWLNRKHVTTKNAIPVWLYNTPSGYVACIDGEPGGQPETTVVDFVIERLQRAFEGQPAEQVSEQDAPPMPIAGERATVPTISPILELDETTEDQSDLDEGVRDQEKAVWIEKYFPKTDDALRGWLVTWDFIAALREGGIVHLRDIVTKCQNSANNTVSSNSKSTISRIITAGAKYRLFDSKELRNRLR